MSELLAQLVEQNLGFFQIRQLEAFGEPVVEFAEHSPRFVVFALLLEQTGEADR
jgi:hypothetical protein